MLKLLQLLVATDSQTVYAEACITTQTPSMSNELFFHSNYVFLNSFAGRMNASISIHFRSRSFLKCIHYSALNAHLFVLNDTNLQTPVEYVFMMRVALMRSWPFIIATYKTRARHRVQSAQVVKSVCLVSSCRLLRRVEQLE